MGNLQDKERAILLLQGPPSAFWHELGDAFRASGASVYHINFSMSDWVYWRRPGAVNYRGRLSRWPQFLENFIRRHGITDILYYADRVPYHAMALEVSKRMDISAFTMEFGYLRPDWLTLERGGMGALSHFPSDPAVIQQIARRAGPYRKSEARYSHPFAQEAVNEVFYNLTAALIPYFFPFYRSDKYYHPLVDYLGWLPRALRKQRNEPRRLLRVRELRSKRLPYWLLALQIQSDYQLRANSNYKHQADMIDEVLGSFAENAGRDEYLIVKLHPLDNGIERWEKVVEELAVKHKLEGRVVAVSDCNLRGVIRRSRGVITINSTVGLHSLRDGVPVKVLGTAIYDVVGLTHQGTLGSFWKLPQPVDKALCDDLVSAMAATIQVHGSFYNAAGRKAACEEISARILRGGVNSLGSFIDPPPRLCGALRSGVPVYRSLKNTDLAPAGLTEL